ncbi:MAG: class I SAM-dependent methyltransferase [Ignavibacteriales bacterium]|nr:class I SAM-dependent methyltransferase [Ignavibacteriales bacterium]
MHKHKIISATKFYDSISDVYDKMIDFEKNLDLRFNAYKELFPLPGTVADIGCGIGLDSIALAMNGHKVTAFDISPNMIEELKRNADKYQVTIETHIGSFTSISPKFNTKFNNVVSVGNTIAHLDQKELKSAIRKIYKLLQPGGKIFLHILNYKLIKKQNKRINNIANRDGKIIIRFYDFLDDRLNFNILSFATEAPKDFKLITTCHYPHSKNEINSYLKSAGFQKVKFMGNFFQEKFNANESKDIFIEAVKS